MFCGVPRQDFKEPKIRSRPGAGERSQTSTGGLSWRKEPRVTRTDHSPGSHKDRKYGMKDSVAKGEESQWPLDGTTIPHSPCLRLAPYHRQKHEVGVLQGGHLGLSGKQTGPTEGGKPSVWVAPQRDSIKFVCEIMAGCSHGSAKPGDYTPSSTLS